MSTELTPMQNLQEKMQEHIKQKFAEIVPEEVWKGLTDKVINDYIEVQLPILVKAEMENLCKAKLKEIFNSPDFQGPWEKGGYMASKALEKVLVENAPELFAKLIGSSLQSLLMNMNVRY